MISILNNFKKTNRKETFATFAIIILMTAAAILTAFPSAHAAITVKTNAWISASPNPAAVNQQVLVIFWVLPLSPTFNDTTTGEHYQNYQVTITDPDGVTTNKGPFTPPAVGSTYFLFNPSKIGTYTFSFSYPGQTMGNGNTYAPSQGTATLTVQQNGIHGLPDLPMPSGYWTRPISGEARGWGSVTGPWLMTNYNAFSAAFGSQAGWNPYTEAPLSSHILWAKQIAVGGIAGGQLGDLSFYPGLSYELRLTPPIIMDGRLWYNLYPPTFAGSGGIAKNGFACLDLRTGQELYRVMDTRITLGQQIFISDANQLGAFEYVWDMGSANWTMYDALTGSVQARFYNTVSGKVTFDNTGNMLIYLFSGTPGRQWAALWNETLAIPELSGSYYMWNPSGNYNFLNGIQWNMTLPYNGTYNSGYSNSSAQSLLYFNGQKGVATIQTFNGGPAFHIGYDFTGNQIRLLWTKERAFQSIACFGAIGDDVYVQLNSADGKIYAWSLTTGEQVWVTDSPSSAWGTEPGNPTIADGKLYSPTYDGYVHVYNVTNGKEIYKFFGSASSDVPYGQYPFYTGPILGGNVAFVPTMEHSPSMPLYKGETLYAFDKNTGQFLWNITGYYQTGAIAEGNLILYNAYDGRMYNFGKGPSATTVLAPQTGISVGSGAMITGTVTDQTAGQKGTPAISDESMSSYMEYLYMDHAKPDATGVSVTLTAVNSNGQSAKIADVTCDGNGNFGYQWTPAVEGTYKIVATFAGSNSYGGSDATTYLGVGPKASAVVTPTLAPTTTPPATIAPTVSPSPSIAQQPTSGMPTMTYVAITAAIVIIAVAAAAVILKRRK